MGSAPPLKDAFTAWIYIYIRRIIYSKNGNSGRETVEYPSIRSAHAHGSGQPDFAYLGPWRWLMFSRTEPALLTMKRCDNEDNDETFMIMKSPL
jgi:hypothetical protein